MIPVMAKDIVFTPKSPRFATPLSLEQRILTHIKDNDLPLVFHGYLGEFKGLQSRIALTCTRCGNRADKSATNLLNEGKRCACFRSDYFQYKAGVPYLYVMQSDDIGKFGVTKSIIKRRINLGVRNPGHNFDIVYAREMPSMKHALATERAIKRMLDVGIGGIEYGKTETFHYCNKSLNNIKNIASVEWN